IWNLSSRGCFAAESRVAVPNLFSRSSNAKMYAENDSRRDKPNGRCCTETETRAQDFQRHHARHARGRMVRGGRDRRRGARTASCRRRLSVPDWRVYKYRSRLRRRLSYDPRSERQRWGGFSHEFRSWNYRCHQGGEGTALAKLTPDA